MSIQIPSHPKCIILDWDGTLVDAEENIHKAYIETFKSLKRPLAETWTRADTHNRNGIAPHLIFNETGIWGHDNAGTTGKAYNLFYAHLYKISEQDPSAPHLKENALELLHTLKRKYPQARFVLLAGKRQEILEREVAQKPELTGFFSMIIGTDTQKKIHKQSAYALDIATMGIEIASSKKQRAADIIYIGDNPWIDTPFANHFGAMPIIVNDQEKTAHFKSLKDLSNALKKDFLENHKMHFGQKILPPQQTSYYDHQHLK